MSRRNDTKTHLVGSSLINPNHNLADNGHAYGMATTRLSRCYDQVDYSISWRWLLLGCNLHGSWGVKIKAWTW